MCGYGKSNWMTLTARLSGVCGYGKSNLMCLTARLKGCVAMVRVTG